MRKASTILGFAGALALATTGLATTALAEGVSAGEPAKGAMAAADSPIERAVQKKLSERKALREVRVSAEQGTVTLRGSVERAAERTQAESLASSVKGVESVRNEIRVVASRGASSPPPGDR